MTYFVFSGGRLGSVRRGQVRSLRAKTEPGKDAGSVNGSAIRLTEDAARRRFAAARTESGSTDWAQAAGPGQTTSSWTAASKPPPDAPVSNFSLTLDAGNKGLLQNNTNLCKHSLRVSADIPGQNGKTANQKSPELQTPCKKKSKRHKRHRALEGGGLGV
jgi:hypothetical protein